MPNDANSPEIDYDRAHAAEQAARDTEIPDPPAPAAPIPKIRDPTDAILELRKENQRLRQTANDKADARADRRIEELRSAAEATATEAAEQKYRDRLIKAELRSIAAQTGAVDLDDTITILESSGFQPELDPETGDVTNAEAAIAALRQSKPHLFRSGGTPARAPIAAAPSPEPAAPKRPIEMSQREYEIAKARLCHADDPHRGRAQLNRKYPGSVA